MNITCRNMTKSDYKDVKSLIRKAWYDEYKFSDKIKDAYASAYFHECMANSNYRLVACDGDKVVGFIFGRLNKVKFIERFKHMSKFLFLKFCFMFTKWGRRKNKIFAKTDKVNNELLKQMKHKTNNELVLFIVDDNYQRNGIGSKLEKDLLEYLKNNNANSLYLYSDTFSNYQFYERRNYIRCGEMEVDFAIKGEEKDPLPTYFIYYKEF